MIARHSHCAVHSQLREAGAAPAPDPATVTASCTCAGRKAPCVHVLATYFDVARRLDERPRTAIVLRGLTGAPGHDTARIPIGLLDPARFYTAAPDMAR